MSKDALETIKARLPVSGNAASMFDRQMSPSPETNQESTISGETEPITPIEEFSKLMENQPQARIVSTLDELVRVHGTELSVWAILVKLFDRDVSELKRASEGRLKFIRKIDFLQLAMMISQKGPDPIEKSGRIGVKQELTKKEEPICKQESTITKCADEVVPIEQVRLEKEVEDKTDTEIKVIKEDSMKLEAEPKIVNILDENGQNTSQASLKKEECVKIQEDSHKVQPNSKGESPHAPIRKEEDLEDFPGDQLVDELRVFVAGVAQVVEHSIMNADRLSKVQFDKDVASHVRVVKSLTNMRCFVYRIKSVGEEELRKKLGNIVPAISHTNAIIAGLLFQNMQKVFLRQFLQEQLKHLEVDINLKAADKLSKREQLLLHILKTREFALVNGEMQKLVNMSNMRPKQNCATCSVKRRILHVPSNMSLKSFGKALAELMKLKEMSVFFKGELVYEQFEGEESSDEEPELYGPNLNQKERAEINKKIQCDPNLPKRPRKGGFQKLLEFIESKKRNSSNKKEEPTTQGNLSEISQKVKNDPKSADPKMKNEEEEDVSQDRIRELVIMDQDSIPQFVGFVLLNKEAGELKMRPANDDVTRFDFVEKELRIPHLNNYVLGKKNSALKLKNVCSLESNSKSKKKNSSLEKRSKKVFFQNKKPIENILADNHGKLGQSKRLKIV